VDFLIMMLQVIEERKFANWLCCLFVGVVVVFCR